MARSQLLHAGQINSPSLDHRRSQSVLIQKRRVLRRGFALFHPLKAALNAKKMPTPMMIFQSVCQLNVQFEQTVRRFDHG
jgi:hypothetical protein